MRVLGIVSEYNPFHNGHLYHLKKSMEKTKADYSVCIMSGNFLQRGEPALFDKWVRAEAAVKNGIDLVLELPAVFACSSAEFFAQTAIAIFNGLGCVDYISFGSENGDIHTLYQVAEILAHEPDSYKELLKRNISKGITFPLARKIAINEMSALGEVLDTPNNILGIEYIKALIRTQSNITPLTMQRMGANYHDQEIQSNICSATAIRNKLQEQNNNIQFIRDVIPAPTFDILERNIEAGITPLYLADLYTFISYKILISDSSELGDVFSAVEGIENRISNIIRNARSIEDLIRLIKSKRYTQTSIQRLLIHILLGIKKYSMQKLILDKSCLYGRVLGFSSKGAQLIRYIKEKEINTIPLITNINKEVPPNSPISQLLHYDILASDIYHLASNRYNLYSDSDYVKKPFIFK